MVYKKAMEYIHSLLRFGSRPGLERITKLLELLENPQDKLSVVHIAGTNGKGSTACMCASVLTAAGYKTAMFTSPFVVEFRERMQIDGQMISEKALSDCVAYVKGYSDIMESQGECPTEFEFITAVALYWFSQQRCDIVCLEVGLGGRFDATNVMKAPLVSVITSIGLDHVDILGDTIEKIAFEKCGIIKQGCPVVSYPMQKPEALGAIMESCSQKNCRLYMHCAGSAHVIKSDVFGNTFIVNGVTYTTRLGGIHQVYNALTAMTVFDVLSQNGYAIPTECVQSGLDSAIFPARVEVLCRQPLVVVDGAHNVDKTEALRQAVEGYAGKIVAIHGMLQDKDYEGAVSLLTPLCCSVITVRPNSPRALCEKILAQTAAKYCNDVTSCEEYSEAVRLALEKVSPDGMILAWGSLYLAGNIRKELQRQLLHNME